MSNLDQFDDELCDEDIVIYPYPHGTAYPFDNYDHDHLVNFSKISIEKFNKDEGRNFEFLELKEGLLYSTIECDRITAYFKARDRRDGTILIFRAFTDCPFEGSLEHSPPRSVLPISDFEAQNLEEQLEQLQVEIMTSLLETSLLDGTDDGMDDGMDDDDSWPLDPFGPGSFGPGERVTAGSGFGEPTGCSSS